MAMKEYNVDLDIKGKVLATDVPTSTGSIVTWNRSTNVFGLRTDAQIISDLKLSSNFVPYTGATANVNLGARSITSTGGFIGNATTATTLATARTINGTSFNGSANITTANWGTARNITIGNTTKSVNGSENVSWSLAEIGVNTGDFVPYTGANQPININTQSFTTSGDIIKNNTVLERNIFGTGTGVSNNLRKYNNVAHYIGSNTSSAGIIRIVIPITSATMWNAQLSIQEYSSSESYSPVRRTTLKFGAYSLGNGARFVICDNPDRVAKVEFGRDSLGNTIINIHSSSGHFSYERVILDWVQSTYYHSSNLNDKTKYSVSFVAQADIPTQDFTLNGEVLNSGFQRDSYLWNKGDFTQSDINNWNTAFGWGDYRQFGLGIDGLEGSNTWDKTLNTVTSFHKGSDHGITGITDKLVWFRRLEVLVDMVQT